MNFSKQFLLDLIYDELTPGNGSLISDKIVDTSRWSEIHSVVFSFKGNFYSTSYSQGLTEYQDESPFEHEADAIECTEVFPVETTVTKYTTRKRV